MYPTIGQVGIFEVTSYSLMLGLSFAVGLVIAAARAKRAEIDPALVVGMSFWAMVGALAGSRLFYVLVNPGEFSENPLAAINPIRNGTINLSGLVMNGGIIGALLAASVFTWRTKLPLLKTLDTVAPALGIGVFLTRLGCFLNGCCFGRPTDLPWGVVFPAASPAGHFQRIQLDGLQPIHPTQIYSAAYGLLIFGSTLAMEKRFKGFDGFTTFLVLMCYGAARFSVEFLRHQGASGLLTHNQYISVLFIVAGATGVALKSGRTTDPNGRRQDCHRS
jgi:phosphatidylglycerol:prolipoprotein diacylglycerol transferase